MSKKKKTQDKEVLVEEALEGESAESEKDQPQAESEAPVEKTDSCEAAEEVPKLELPLKEIMVLKTELEESQAKADEYLDGWQRARADFANYKKRVERDRQQINKSAVGDVTRRYLPVVDDLERALKDRPQSGDGAAWADGIELVYRKLVSILEADGITAMEAEGEIFDPNLHEAIVKTESDAHESDQIIEVLEQGYMIADRVLRPAKVRIAA